MRQGQKEHNLKETSRVEAFSDGVFAIAITLLVLELITTLHPGEEASILSIFKEHWQSFFAFTIGFITILVCWINHHLAMEYVKKTDIRFMWVNGFLLFVVTLTPFPTAILAEYLEKEPRTAVAIYGFNYFLISIAAYAICQYAYKHHFIDENDMPFYRAYKKTYLYSIFYTLVAFIICLFSSVIPMILYALMFFVFASPKYFANILYTKDRKRKTD